MQTTQGSSDTQDLASYARGQAQRVMKKIPLLGAVSWLMMQQSATCHWVFWETVTGDSGGS